VRGRRGPGSSSSLNVGECLFTVYRISFSCLVVSRVTAHGRCCWWLSLCRAEVSSATFWSSALALDPAQKLPMTSGVGDAQTNIAALDQPFTLSRRLSLFRISRDILHAGILHHHPERLVSLQLTPPQHLRDERASDVEFPHTSTRRPRPAGQQRCRQGRDMEAHAGQHLEWKATAGKEPASAR
jgi:hypothetical protein